ncbi:MAG: hypothetical protein CMJ20_04330, partial [Phycisphaeraceae bacterium]|nr:hypothetical protein [Phycisphaeraceae bacterium]
MPMLVKQIRKLLRLESFQPQVDLDKAPSVKPFLAGLEPLEPRILLSANPGIAIPQDTTSLGMEAQTISLNPLDDISLLSGSPYHLPLNGSDANGEPLTFTAQSNNETVNTTILTGNRSLRINVESYGSMIFELYEGRASRATEHIIELVESGFYNNIIFHRVINGFMIQGGDPTGTGQGGSELGTFDDHFHVELQHNRVGVLSMAKSADDTNDSQFFITEVPTRYLDFNHSIFGQLVEGDDVREAISNAQTDNQDRPTTPIVISSAEIFIDDSNGILMLSAPEGTTTSAQINVTTTNISGDQTTQSFIVDVTPDTHNAAPFLADIEAFSVPAGGTASFQLSILDAEADPAFYLDQDTLNSNGLAVPTIAPDGIEYAVDFNSGEIMIQADETLLGTYDGVSVATAVALGAVDYQVVPVRVGNYSLSNGHVHQSLDIRIHGQTIAIPSHIGVSAQGVTSFTHTHDADNKVHIHPLFNGQTPSQYLTLGDFFNTWQNHAGLAGNNPNAIFNQSQIMEHVADGQNTIRMYVNGVLNDQYENYVLQEGDDIVIAYGIDTYHDLEATIGSKIKLPDQVVAGDGTKLTVPLEITNLGNIAIERGTRIAVDIIAMPTAGGDEITIDRIENVSISNLRPGKIKRVNLRTTLPVEGLDGNYQLLVKVDATDLVTEELGEQILEDNNSTLTSIDDAINVSPGYRDLASA